MHDQRRPQAVVAGHICLDITPAFGASETSLSSLIMPGKLTHVGAADVHTGGCVANTGLALRRLGIPTRLVARVGDDVLAGVLHTLLAAEGDDANLSLSIDKSSSTSYSIVLAPPGIDRMFLHNAGANERFCEADVPDSLLAGASLLHFGYPPLMLRMCQDNGAELLSLFRRAKALGLATSMDMASIDPASEAARLHWPSLLAKLLPLVDFFLPSAEELCFMIDPARYAQWQARAASGDVTDTLDIQQDVAPLAEQLIQMGAAVIVIKCGRQGMCYRSAGKQAIQRIGLSMDSSSWENLSGHMPAYKPDKVVCATGAGDASIAGFLASVLEGLSFQRCVQRAAAVGACCVEAIDALSGLRPLAVLDQRIASGWETNR